MAILSANRGSAALSEERQEREAAQENAERTAAPSEASPEETIARLGVELEQRTFELDLARRSEERLQLRVQELEEDLAVVDGMRSALRRKLDERDRLLSVIFESRSWRLMQSLRNLLRRS